MTAAYMKNPHSYHEQYSLFPDIDPNSAAWTGPPPGIFTVLFLLYASFAMSVFAVSLAMDGRRWTDKYLQPCGGSAADKNRDRQRKLDEFEKWLAIKSSPIMLRLAVALLWSALMIYFWNVHHTTA